MSKVNLDENADDKWPDIQAINYPLACDDDAEKVYIREQFQIKIYFHFVTMCI